MPQVVSLFILLILVIRNNSYTINCVATDFIVLFYGCFATWQASCNYRVRIFTPLIIRSFTLNPVYAINSRRH